MATINYTCDTCKRSVELIENKLGISSFSSCTITRDCRGNLYATKRNPNNSRQSIPKYDRELDDYIPRNLFYAHTQDVASLSWTVNHGLGLSCVFIVYDSDGALVDNDNYTVSRISDGISLLTFGTKTTGSVHVLSRTGGIPPVIVVDTSTTNVQISYNDIITFAVPKYITRFNSGSTPIEPDPLVPVTPTPTPTPLPTQPYTPCDKTIRIEIEITKPNEPSVTCVETLDTTISAKSPWFGWSEILVKNRKHYCVKSKKISELRVFANTNNQKLIIPDGTRMRITRIDYGTGVLQNIPDRGLLVLMANNPYSGTDKILDKLIDCGEMVNTKDFEFKNYNLHVASDIIEDAYPKISKYS